MEQKNLKIYRFGGRGNDWCFVRLPDFYDPGRKAAYPFVICNHGNGWEMDGSPEMANWTDRTMYVPGEVPASDRAQRTGTEKESLWYSNPVTEELLKAGFLVCGCENYGDRLYGNEDCRTACAEFYRHMRETYHVTEECFMIGASNGAQTSIQTALLLGDKVKALVLQYPLTCLIDQYKDSPSMQEQIRKAYGASEEEIIGVLEKEDILRKKIGIEKAEACAGTGIGTGKQYFPPALLLYSSTDTVVNGEKNACSFYRYLKENGIRSELVRVDADGVPREHGDQAHFMPERFLEWFRASAPKLFS